MKLEKGLEDLFGVSLAFSTRNQTGKDQMERKARRNIPISFMPANLNASPTIKAQGG